MHAILQCVVDSATKRHAQLVGNGPLHWVHFSLMSGQQYLNRAEGILYLSTAISSKPKANNDKLIALLVIVMMLNQKDKVLWKMFMDDLIEKIPTVNKLWKEVGRFWEPNLPVHWDRVLSWWMTARLGKLLVSLMLRF